MMWGKGNSTTLLVRIQTVPATLEINMVDSQKIRNNLHQYTTIPLWGIYPKDTQSCCKDMGSAIFIAALFVIARIWNQLQCPSIKEWIKKMWYIYIMEKYKVEKINDILKFAGK